MKSYSQALVKFWHALVKFCHARFSLWSSPINGSILNNSFRLLNNFDRFEHVLQKHIAIWIHFENAAKLSYTIGILRPHASTWYSVHKMSIILRRSSSHVSSGQQVVGYPRSTSYTLRYHGGLPARSQPLAAHWCQRDFKS